MNQRGFLFLPLAACLSAFAAMGLALLAYSVAWRRLAHSQLRLDRCIVQGVGEAFRILNGLEEMNARVRELRARIHASRPNVAGLEQALAEAVREQDALLSQWSFDQPRWPALQGCGSTEGEAARLGFWRGPADELGPPPLSWPQDVPREIRLELGSPPRRSAALLIGGLHESEFHWSRRWTQPVGRTNPD